MPKKFLKNPNAVPADLVDGGHPSQVLIEEPELLMDNNRLCFGRIPPRPDMSEIDDFASKATDSVDLRVQQVDLGFQLPNLFLHIRHLIFNLRH